MLTFSSNQIHEPLFQKMAVFRVRQDYTNPQTSKLLHGILALNSAPLVLDNDTLKELRKDENFAKLLSSDKAVFTNCSVFLESSIKSNAYFIQDENEKMNLLLQLRQNSLYPSQEIVSEPEPFTDFIMNYQMHQKEYPEFVKNFKNRQKSESKSVSGTNQNQSTS